MDIVERLREFEHNWADKLDMADACQDAADEIERLRRYADAMNGKPGTERHIYNGACPDNGQPDSRDPECPACRLLVPNATEFSRAAQAKNEADAA